MAVIRKNPEDFGVRRSSRGPPTLSESSNDDDGSSSDSSEDFKPIKKWVPYKKRTVHKYISGQNQSIPNVEVLELPFPLKKSIMESVHPIQMMNLLQLKSRYDSYHRIILQCEWITLIIVYLGRNWGRQNWKGVGCPWWPIRIHW